MSEQYRKNVQVLCDEIGIVNPIQEEDLKVKGLAVYTDGEWCDIAGTDMNRAGRLFFQHMHHPFVRPDDTYGYTVTLKLKFLMAGYFAENWIDATEKGRTMLIHLQRAEKIGLVWK